MSNGTSYPFFTGGDAADGDQIIPIANGTHYTKGMLESNDESEVYLEFFSDAAATVPASPTGGTITLAGRPMEHLYLAASSNTVIQANTVTTPTATYTPPVLDGKVNKARLVLAGITGGGVTHMKATVFKHI